MGKENNALLPIHVERIIGSGEDNRFVVSFGLDGKLGQIMASVPEGDDQSVRITSLHRGPLLEDDILDEDLKYEAEQHIQRLKQLPEQRAVTFNAGAPRPKD